MITVVINKDKNYDNDNEIDKKNDYKFDWFEFDGSDVLGWWCVNRPKREKWIAVRLSPVIYRRNYNISPWLWSDAVKEVRECGAVG